MPLHVAHPPRVVPDFGSGWIASTSWQNDTGTPVSWFSTTWEVPPEPASDSGQTIFLFNGIQSSGMIYQPVLQWGESGAGGGDYWALASWYMDGQSGFGFHSTLVEVDVGDVVTGLIRLTHQADSSFDYMCEFVGIGDTRLPVQNVEELRDCVETLEAYGITGCNDYPNTHRTRMTSIQIKTAGVSPALAWSISDDVTDCGQHATVPNGSSIDGEVDLCYRRGDDHFYTTSASERDNAVTQDDYLLEGTACFVFSTPQTATVDLYRLFNPGNGHHFYTTSESEREHAIAHDGYVSENTACYVYIDPPRLPLFRLFNPGNGHHFYTTSESEREHAMAHDGYVSENMKCYVFTKPQAGASPLFRLYNPGIGDHLYTTSASEREHAMAHDGYVSENMQCYVFTKPQSGASPLFRLYNPGIGDHFYTTSPNEREHAIAHDGYVSENMKCYVFTELESALSALFRLYNPGTGDHFYTTSASEREHAIAHDGYVSENTACYVYTVNQSGTSPLFRLYGGLA
jgi:hypothetical protein